MSGKSQPAPELDPKNYATSSSHWRPALGALIASTAVFVATLLLSGPLLILGIALVASLISAVALYRLGLVVNTKPGFYHRVFNRLTGKADGLIGEIDGNNHRLNFWTFAEEK